MVIEIENYSNESEMISATSRKSSRHILGHEAFRIIKNNDGTFQVRWALPGDLKHSDSKTTTTKELRIRELRRKGRDGTITASELLELLRKMGFFS